LRAPRFDAGASGNVDFINWRWFTSLITHARMGCGGRTVSRRQPKV